MRASRSASMLLRLAVGNHFRPCAFLAAYRLGSALGRAGSRLPVVAGLRSPAVAIALPLRRLQTDDVRKQTTLADSMGLWRQPARTDRDQGARRASPARTSTYAGTHRPVIDFGAACTCWWSAAAVAQCRSFAPSPLAAVLSAARAGWLRFGLAGGRRGGPAGLYLAWADGALDWLALGRAARVLHWQPGRRRVRRLPTFGVLLATGTQAEPVRAPLSLPSPSRAGSGDR